MKVKFNDDTYWQLLKLIPNNFPVTAEDLKEIFSQEDKKQ